MVEHFLVPDGQNFLRMALLMEKQCSSEHNIEEGNWMMNFHSGQVAGFTYKVIPQVIPVVSQITHLSILYANKRYLRHVSAAPGVSLQD